MARTAFLLVAVATVVVLTSSAGPPPNLDQALEAQRQLVAEEPYSAQAHSDLGNLLLLAADEAAAEAAYQRAIELDAAYPAARFNLAVLKQQTDRTEEAETLYLELLEIAPRHGWGNYQLGVLYDERGERAKAVEYYARAFAYDPDLTFSKNNPHIIDNRYSTEALLRSSRYRGSTSVRVPRHYGDPERIVALMLDESPAVEQREDPLQPARASRSDEGRAQEQRERRERRRGAAQSAAEDEEPRPPAGDEEWVSDEEEEDEDSEDGSGGPVVSTTSIPSRQVTRDSTPARSRATTRAGRSTTATALPSQPPDRQDAVRPQTPRPSRAPQARPEADSGRRQAPTRTQVAPRRQRIRPGRLSTGRLELRLLPEETAEATG